MISDEECAANADLIAAAPDLLQQLKSLLSLTGTIEVLGEWSALDANRTSSKKARAQVEEVEALCRLAIAKAEGLS